MPSIQGRRKGFLVSNEIEFETFTCGHNQEVVRVPHGAKLEDLGVFCHGCMRPICVDCAAVMAKTLRCDVIEKKQERAEARAKFWSDIGRPAPSWTNEPDSDLLPFEFPQYEAKGSPSP